MTAKAAIRCFGEWKHKSAKLLTAQKTLSFASIEVAQQPCL